MPTETKIVQFELSERQGEAWTTLCDDSTVEVLYGGAAGGGKSYLGCLWQITNRLNYPNTRGLIGRRVLQDLKKSTMNTFFTLLTQMGKVAGKDYFYNAQDQIIKWSNGSQTLFVDLDWKPSDPDFNRLGGFEVTDVFVDEATEISLKAFEILKSRIRWKLAEYHLKPKILLTCNPGWNWVRQRYIKDDEGNPILLKPYQKVIKALVTDNPDKAFVSIYQENLEQIDNEFDKQRLLFGNWDIVERTGAEFYSSFNRDVNVGEVHYNPDLALHVTFDFNVQPHMTCLVWQMEQKEGNMNAYQIDELCLSDPLNSTPAVCRELAEKYKGHRSGMFIYGDPAGASQDTRNERGQNDYTLIKTYLAIFRPEFRVANKAPSVVMRGNFINSIFQCKVQGVKVVISPQCTHTIADYFQVKKAQDGTKNKKRINDPVKKISYEPYGHCTDANDYYLCQVFAKEYMAFQTGGKPSRPSGAPAQYGGGGKLGRW